MIDLSSLNDPQRQATQRIYGPTLILAGAGTGKTRVITTRMAYMMKQGIDPASIVAMTFTNKAAKEMKERIRALVGKEAKNLHIGTFHSFCLRILRRFHEAIGLAKGFSLASTADQIDLVRRALEEKGWSNLYQPKDLQALISQAKNHLLLPSDVAKMSLSSRSNLFHDPKLVSEIYELYERQLSLNKVIDFDDCILKVHLALTSYPELKETIEKDLQFLMIDEFQDTNFSQLQIIKSISGSEHNVCAVGDDDQSIYSWRGAMFEIMAKFEQLFPKTKLIKLEQNYRCPSHILNIANGLIKQNNLRKDKTLWSTKANKDPVILAACHDEHQEARWIAEKCLSQFGRGTSPSDIAIIYRANAQAKPIETVLREYGVNYKTYGGQSFFEKKEIKDFLAYLRLIVKPTDYLAFWRIINRPTRGLGIKTLETLEQQSSSLHVAPFEALSNLESIDLTARSKKILTIFREKIKKGMLMEKKSPQDLYNLAEFILNEFRLLEDIKEKTKSVLLKQSKIENLKGMARWLYNTANSSLADTGVLDSVELIDQLTLQDPFERGNNDEKKQGVSLMTIHASKGLEFPVVFVCGLEEELLPHKNSLNDPRSIQEERRLLYVAITRSKANLYLSHAIFRISAFKRVSRDPSRFLAELPSEYIVKDGTEVSAESKEDRQTRTRSKLSNLRSQLLTNSESNV